MESVDKGTDISDKAFDKSLSHGDRLSGGRLGEDRLGGSFARSCKDKIGEIVEPGGL